MRNALLFLALTGCAAGDPDPAPRFHESEFPLEPPAAPAVYARDAELAAPLRAAVDRLRRATGLEIAIQGSPCGDQSRCRYAAQPVFFTTSPDFQHLGLTTYAGIEMARGYIQGDYEAALLHELMHLLGAWSPEATDIYGHVAQGQGVFSPNLGSGVLFTPCDYASLCGRHHCPRWYPEIDHCD